MSATTENKIEELQQARRDLLEALEDLNKYEEAMFHAYIEYRYEGISPADLNLEQVKDCLRVANKLRGKPEKDFL